MKYDKLLKSLNKKVGSQVAVRRYSLPEIISESYKALYQSEEGTNLHKLLEAHLEDVRNNPSDIDKLSSQLSIMKEIIRLKEAKKLSDNDLILSDKVSNHKKLNEGVQLPGSLDIFLKDLAQEYNYFTYKDIANHNYTDTEIKDLRKARINYLNTIDEVEDSDDRAILDIVKSVADIVTLTGKKVNLDKTEESKEEDFLDESELTEAEVEELTKHLTELRKNKKACECNDTEKPVEESKSRRLRKKDSVSGEKGIAVSKEDNLDESKEDSIDSIYIQRLGSKLIHLSDKMDAEGIEYLYLDDEKPVDSKAYLVTSVGYMDLEDPTLYLDNHVSESVESNTEDNGELVDKKDHDTVAPKKKVTESISWSKINLSEFNEKSSSKAFVKTFKKLDSKLHEGTALTRQESINLYKAANSAMTHLSVELEHNPEFLSTFNEATTLLTSDINKILESMKNGKAPSKKTMKSLAKFSEALLESEKEIIAYDMEGMTDTPKVGEDFRVGNNVGKCVKVENNKAYMELDNLKESDEDIPPVEDEEIPYDDTELDDDSSESEEAEDFDQEYADARVELHKDLVDKHGDTEDIDIQDKIAQDAEEVETLPGITDDQIAEIENLHTSEEESSEGESDEETPEDSDKDEEETEDELEDSKDIDSDITEDELAELKKHLTEMRKNRN